MTLAFFNTNKYLLNNQQILRSGEFFYIRKELFDCCCFFFVIVLILSVRYKQRGHINDQLVEHHRQSSLGKLKNGAAIGVFPPKDDKNLNIRKTPNDFK